MTTMTTNDTMTADEAQRLLDGATPGEWGAYRPYEYPKDFRLASLQGPPVRYVGRLTRSHPNEPHPTKGDAALCAAAPRLAASVVALHAHLAQVTAERDALRRALAAAATGKMPRCETCGDRLATRQWSGTPNDPCGVCDRCFREEQHSEADVGNVLDEEACVDLPHAAVLRDAIGGAK